MIYALVIPDIAYSISTEIVIVHTAWYVYFFLRILLQSYNMKLRQNKCKRL